MGVISAMGLSILVIGPPTDLHHYSFVYHEQDGIACLLSTSLPLLSPRLTLPDHGIHPTTTSRHIYTYQQQQQQQQATVTSLNSSFTVLKHSAT